jgi:hypothetical protein
MNGSMKACALYILHYINLHSYTLISSRNFEERKMLFFSVLVSGRKDKSGKKRKDRIRLGLAA